MGSIRRKINFFDVTDPLVPVVATGTTKPELKWVGNRDKLDFVLYIYRLRVIIYTIIYHYYRNDLWSFTFVPASIGPRTNIVISPGSNG